MVRADSHEDLVCEVETQPAPLHALAVAVQLNSQPLVDLPIAPPLLQTNFRIVSELLVKQLD